MNTLGDRIKKIRKGLNLNQVDFALKIGLESAVAISQYESNRREPDINKLKKICEVGNISLDELLTGEYKENQTGLEGHIIKDTESPYEPNIDKIKISEDLILTTRVLESNSPYAMALHLNIRSFAQAVEAKERILIVETNQKNMQAEISELRKEVNRLKITYEGPGGNDGNLTNTNKKAM